MDECVRLAMNSLVREGSFGHFVAIYWTAQLATNHQCFVSAKVTIRSRAISKVFCENLQYTRAPFRQPDLGAS